MNYNWNWSILWEMSPDGGNSYLVMLLAGLAWTLATTAAASILAFILGAGIGVLRTLPNRVANAVGNLYVEIFRNIPLLVQMFLWFFVVPEIVPRGLGLWLKQLSPFYTAVLALGLYTSARVANVVYSGIVTLPRGQAMAGAALGFTLAQTYRHILLPLAFRHIVPPLTSEVLGAVKNSSVALTIGLMELTARARAMQEFTFQVFEAFTAATLLYLATSWVIVVAMRRVERLAAYPGSMAASRT